LKILAIDTATENCSAALWVDGRVVQREVEVERGHAELILTMIDELLAESSATLGSLDAIAFGRGPGSFTGVRLAASVTQGLAFGADLPVVAVSDLQAVAQRAFVHGHLEHAAARHALVCNDARMQEVYWACFQRGHDDLMEPVGIERVSKCSAVELPDEWEGTLVSGAGRGFRAYAELTESLGARLTNIRDNILPGAREIAFLAVAEVRAGRVVPAEQAIPIYVRDDVARPKGS
jgi:tRNA threonylcarbamoyladenosine biosynthesis protein TsaB